MESSFLSGAGAIFLLVIFLIVVFGILPALISKISGTSIKTKDSILGGKGNVIATPDTLDDLGKGVRGIFDKKYKIKQEIQREYNAELRKKIAPLDNKIVSIIVEMSLIDLNKDGGEIKLRKEKILKDLEDKKTELVKQKDILEREIKMNYDKKLGDMKYL
ncbi:MAG: hypothetical protein HY064_02210 [Bacteroidetes bacterium]|nr:hypothetical protein [Bacteroidota bacterium]